MPRLARRQVTLVALENIQASGENLPLSHGIADTVVVSLCTIPDPKVVVAEIRSILKSDWRLLSIENDRAETHLLENLQTMLGGTRSRFACGCHLTRSGKPQSRYGTRKGNASLCACDDSA